MDIQEIHTILIEANLPSNINDLKNPTEEFVVNLMKAFLTKFHIDVSRIERSTMEQQDVMLFREDSEVLGVIVGLINLHVVMAQIYQRIFLPDMCITDITNPGPKRLRRQLRYLTNFVVYTANKETEIQGRINNIQNRALVLQELLNKKTLIQDAISEKALHTANELSLKEKYLVEIEQMQSRIEKNNVRYYELLAEMASAEEKKQQAAEKCGTYKTETLKLTQKIGKLQSEIVKSPEECKKDLQECEEQYKAKVKERDTMQEQFQDKIHLLEQKEKGLLFMRKLLDTLSEIKDVHGQLKKATVDGDNAKKQVDNLRVLSAEVERKLTAQSNEYKESEMEELQIQQEERLTRLRTLHAQLLNNKKTAKIKLEREDSHHNEICLQRDKLRSEVKKVEEETVLLIKNYQELYDDEINTERELRKILVGGTK